MPAGPLPDFAEICNQARYPSQTSMSSIRRARQRTQANTSTSRPITRPTLSLDKDWAEGTLFLPRGHLWNSLEAADLNQLEPLRVLNTNYLLLSADDHTGQYMAVVGPTPWEPLNDSFSHCHTLTIELHHPNGQRAVLADFPGCDNGLVMVSESIATLRTGLGRAATLNATALTITDGQSHNSRSLSELDHGLAVKWWPLSENSPTDPHEITNASEGIDMLLTGTLASEIQWFSDVAEMNDLLADVRV